MKVAGAVSTRVAYRSFAKINLYLQVLERRDDGNHNIETIFQTVDLSDELEFKLAPSEITIECDLPELDLGESNLIWRDRNEVSGSRDPDSGGTTLFLAPGIQYASRRFVLETAVQLPVLQELHGDALENDYIITAGFRVRF